VLRAKAYEAYYKLAAPQEQIKAHVSAAIRARAPKIPLDGLFEVKEDLAQDLKKELLGAMSDCGYTILDVLITDIEPDSAVKHSVSLLFFSFLLSLFVFLFSYSYFFFSFFSSLDERDQCG
jgi:regulator of protease activity HflC (stomatin/prohibitin superfamily)